MKKFGLIFVLLCLGACGLHQKSQTSQGVGLQKVQFSDLNGFEQDHLTEALTAIRLSCDEVQKNPNIDSKSKIKIRTKAYAKICEHLKTTQFSDDLEIRNFLIKYFDPYLVTDNGSAQGKFTAYYEAEIKASKTKHGKYKYPIYGKPNDLIEINLHDFDETLPNKRLLGRIDNQKLIPYLTREQIENHGLDAPVILWGDDKVDIFLMQIQGSAVAALDDGQMVRISYADNNGHRFVGIGGLLLQKGLLKKGEASMDKISDWLKEHPDIAEINMNENPRFIFHRISDANGPIGALGVPLSAGRSLAVDTDFVPLTSLLWLETTAPDGKPLQKLVTAQDIGAAIKGTVRGDYFWGHGQQALQQAGRMNAAGQYYILLPKE